MKVVVGCLGVILLLFLGLFLSINFKSFGCSTEQLQKHSKHHKFLYITKTKPYETKDAFGLLVESIEGLISKENSNWFLYNDKKEGEKNDGQKENFHQL